MKEIATISLDRLHRLRPSDIEAIKKQAKAGSELTEIVSAFASYLLGIKEPQEVELDDVSRIALQLKAADVWETVKPSDFVSTYEVGFSPKVTSALRDVLGIKQRERRTSPAIPKGVYVEVTKPWGSYRSTGSVTHGNLGLSKAQLIDKISNETEVAKKDVRGILETMAAIGYKELKKSGVFLVPGFAKFVVIKKPATKARQGTNPFSGEIMRFKAKPARKIVKATPIKVTKDAI